ncbi:hypothetical protein FPQ18DRAFT_262866 [Pyronema domesticum]|nr:hypothetical protein FPQ18DRAFT_262866 [Pyronema domesticum]
MNLAPQCPAAQTKGRRANVGSKAAGCPFARTRGVASSTFSGSVQSFICTNPTWDDQISKLFSAPYWLEEPERSKVGQSWIRAMKHWGVDLDLEKYDDVKQKATSIYRHMISRSMPLTDDPNHYFPDDAIETYRLWVNQGCRKSLHDITVPGDVIPVPEESKVALRIRKDLRNLTPQELQTYRAQLDDVLGTGRLHSKWQELGLLHAEWCLHYQEATFPWHRAYLRYVEELIDCPIPYWNGFAVDTSDPESPYAGLPKEFLEETYIHPDGTTRPNPMKYALSLNGQSKAGGEFTTRYKVLEDGPSSPDWVGKINLFKKYHEQVKAAMEKPTFSVPMSYNSPFGLPWANLPAFTDDQADDLYPLRELNFDGAFEQPHDNYHGWVGPDMADNAYTGFDPVFLSMHANLDRLFEVYIRAHPEQTYTANFPLRPFTTLGSTIDYSESREFMYATIGDMTKSTQALGYMYAPPAAADFLDLRTMRQQIQKTACPMGYKAQPGSPEVKTPYVLFTDVKCTKESYQIDVFTPKAASLSPDPVENPYFIGRLTLLAMGPEEVVNGKQCAKDRCGAPQQRTVRILEANCVRDALENAGEKELIQVVTDLQTGEVVAESQWRQWPGFVGKLMWGTKRM